MERELWEMCVVFPYEIYLMSPAGVNQLEHGRLLFGPAWDEEPRKTGLNIFSKRQKELIKPFGGEEIFTRKKSFFVCSKLLSDGWEPFATSLGGSDTSPKIQYLCYQFRRRLT
jgi:hypothetical protein